MYGHRWSSTYGETFGESGPAGRMWQVALAGVSNAQIAKALHGCLTREDGAWPPTLPEFRALCVASAKAQPHVATWVPQRADPARMPSAERLQWHKDNIAWVEMGGELPRPNSVEPPAPAGARPFWDIYRGPDLRSSAEKAASRDALAEEWL